MRIISDQAFVAESGIYALEPRSERISLVEPTNDVAGVRGRIVSHSHTAYVPARCRSSKYGISRFPRLHVIQIIIQPGYPART